MLLFPLLANLVEFVDFVALHDAVAGDDVLVAVGHIVQVLHLRHGVAQHPLVVAVILGVEPVLVSLGCSLEGLMLKLKLQYFGHPL